MNEPNEHKIDAIDVGVGAGACVIKECTAFSLYPFGMEFIFCKYLFGWWWGFEKVVWSDGSGVHFKHSIWRIIASGNRIMSN